MSILISTELFPTKQSQCQTLTLLYNYLIGLQYIAYHQEKDVRKKMQPISRVFRRSEKHFRFYDLENSDAAHHLLWGSKSGGRN